MLIFEDVEYALFKGIEQEGPLKGTQTLFVYNKVPTDLILSTAKAEGIQYVYFGAGHLSEHDPESVLRVWGEGFYVTVESVNTPKYHTKMSFSGEWYRYKWMRPVVWKGITNNMRVDAFEAFAAMSVDLDKRTVLVKIDTGNATLVTPLENFITSSYGDYGGDVVLHSMPKKG